MNLNIHLQSYAKNVGRIQDDFGRVVEKINTCDDRVDVLQQRHVDQESFNRAILERMQEMEATIEGQTERIVSLEEEVATLHWRKACACDKEGKKMSFQHHLYTWDLTLNPRETPSEKNSPTKRGAQSMHSPQ